MSEYELWNEIGNLYFLSGAYKPAILAYSKAIELDNKFGRPYSNLALVYVQQGQYERAIGLYRHSIELLSDTRERAISWNRLGNVYRQIKDYALAVSAFQEADGLNPESCNDQEQPGRDTDIPLMLSMPAYNLPMHPAEQTSPESESAFLPDAQTGADQIDVIPQPMELPLPHMEILSEIAPSSLEQPAVEDDFNFPTPQEESDSCSKPTEESPPLQEDGWFPLLLESKKNIYPDQDSAPILLEQATEERKPTAQDDLQITETNSVAILETSLHQDSPCEEMEITAISTIQSGTNLENPPTTPAIETEMQHKVDNHLDVKADNQDLSLPVDKLQPMNEGICLRGSDSFYLPQERYIAQEIEINELKRSIDTNPHNAMAWDALGNHFKNTGQYQESIFAYEHAISIEKSNASFYYHLGLVYAAANRNDDALRLYKKVIDLDPDYGLAHATLSGYYRRMGLEELARRHINKALNNTFQNENEYNRACLESICGNSDSALEFLEQALQKQQSYADWALHDPDLDFVRNDPRFLPLITRYANITKTEDEQTHRKMQIDFTDTSAFVSIKQRE